MTTPKIRALGITQEGAPTRWHATGYVEGVGWLQAWGTSLMAAMAALQALAAARVAPEDAPPRSPGEPPRRAVDRRCRHHPSTPKDKGSRHD